VSLVVFYRLVVVDDRTFSLDFCLYTDGIVTDWEKKEVQGIINK